jgi:hypothetical protein
MNTSLPPEVEKPVRSLEGELVDLFAWRVVLRHPCAPVGPEPDALLRLHLGQINTKSHLERLLQHPDHPLLAVDHVQLLDQREARVGRVWPSTRVTRQLRDTKSTS